MSRHNYRTDLVFVETFVRWNPEDESFVEDIIPADEIDFRFIYRAEDDRSFAAWREKGTYSNCKKISDSSIEVYIPLSRKCLGKGELIHELRLYSPDNNFPEDLRQIRIPKKTGLELWQGASDILSTAHSGTAMLETILYGKSSWQLAKEKYGYKGTEKEYVMAPILAAKHAEEVAAKLSDIITSKTIYRIEASNDENAGIGKTDDIIYLIFK